MKVLVTGGAGFIGSHIVEALAEAGHESVVFDLADDATRDVREPAAVREALRGIDAVCHQAAKVGLDRTFGDAPDYVSHNDLGTAVVLAAMAEARVDRLVIASSMVVYGEGRYDCPEHGWVRPEPRREDDLINGDFEPRCSCGHPLVPGLVAEDAPTDPRNVYAATKLMQEHLAASWARVTGGRVAALRYHNVYGPRMPRDTPYAGVAALFRSALLSGEPPAVFEDGGQRRDFTHVRDVATANVAALEWVNEPSRSAEPGFRAFNAGSGAVRTVGDMARELSTAMNGPKPIVTGGYRLGDVRHVTASSERIRTELGWRPAVGFEDGLAEFAHAGTSLRQGVS